MVFAFCWFLWLSQRLIWFLECSQTRLQTCHFTIRTSSTNSGFPLCARFAATKSMCKFVLFLLSTVVSQNSTRNSTHPRQHPTMQPQHDTHLPDEKEAPRIPNSYSYVGKKHIGGSVEDPFLVRLHRQVLQQIYRSVHGTHSKIGVATSLNMLGRTSTDRRLLMDVLFCYSHGHGSILRFAHRDQGVAFERMNLFLANDVSVSKIGGWPRAAFVPAPTSPRGSYNQDDPYSM